VSRSLVLGSGIAKANQKFHESNRDKNSRLLRVGEINVQRKSLHVIQLKFCNDDLCRLAFEREVERLSGVPSLAQKLRIDGQTDRLLWRTKDCRKHPSLANLGARSRSGRRTSGRVNRVQFFRLG